jgi:transcriptional regulator with XRE-family HTH domain
MGEFAQMIGCSQSSVSRYESGDIIPKRGVIERLIEVANEDEREEIIRALGISGSAVVRGETLASHDDIIVTDEERRWIVKLLRVFRSGYAQPIRAVTENLETFFEFCNLADRNGGTKTGRTQGIVGPGSGRTAKSGSDEKAHRNARRHLPGSGS